jgi:hypothetical protein
MLSPDRITVTAAPTNDIADRMFGAIEDGDAAVLADSSPGSGEYLDPADLAPLTRPTLA